MRIRANSKVLGLARVFLICSLLLFSIYCGISVLRTSRSSNNTVQLSGSGSEPLRKRAHSLLSQTVRHAHSRGEVQQDDNSDDSADAARTSLHAPCPACPACPDRAKQPADERPRIISTAALLHNPRRYHVVTTAQGFSNHWQVRAHHASCATWHTTTRALTVPRSSCKCCMHTFRQPKEHRHELMCMQQLCMMCAGTNPLLLVQAAAGSVRRARRRVRVEST